MNSINILLVEDNEGDIVLTVEALNSGKLLNNISIVKDGQEALDYLHHKGKYKDAVGLPDLILLDLNLPKVDGKEVLDNIKNDPALKIIPVVVLTTSSAEKNILESYTKNANCYITKPVDFAQFMDVIKILEDFWISIVKLPRK